MQGVLEHLKYSFNLSSHPICFFLCLELLFCANTLTQLLSNANPVAALLHCHTLFMLSYSKLLRFTISAMQFNFLIRYFNPEHTARFIAAVVILTAGRLFILF